MITTHHICKNYGSVCALNDISFEVVKGEIVGFLGQNGAGKTSLMRILTTYMRPSSGTIRIDGIDALDEPLRIRQLIGYLPENPPLYENMSVMDYLKFAADIKDVSAKKRRKQIDKVLDQCQLEAVVHSGIATLSKGYKQRVGIAQAIVHEPKLLILDEPTSGLDPIQNLHVRSLIENLAEDITVIFSTHTLSEIEQIAQRVLIIKTGQVVIDQPLEALYRDHAADDGTPLRLEEIFINYHRSVVEGAS